MSNTTVPNTSDTNAPTVGEHYSVFSTSPGRFCTAGQMATLFNQYQTRTPHVNDKPQPTSHQITKLKKKIDNYKAHTYDMQKGIMHRNNTIRNKNITISSLKTELRKMKNRVSSEKKWSNILKLAMSEMHEQLQQANKIARELLDKELDAHMKQVAYQRQIEEMTPHDFQAYLDTMWWWSPQYQPPQTSFENCDYSCNYDDGEPYDSEYDEPDEDYDW